MIFINPFLHFQLNGLITWKGEIHNESFSHLFNITTISGCLTYFFMSDNEWNIPQHFYIPIFYNFVCPTMGLPLSDLNSTLLAEHPGCITTFHGHAMLYHHLWQPATFSYNMTNCLWCLATHPTTWTYTFPFTSLWFNSFHQNSLFLCIHNSTFFPFWFSLDPPFRICHLFLWAFLNCCCCCCLGWLHKAKATESRLRQVWQHNGGNIRVTSVELLSNQWWHVKGQGSLLPLSPQSAISLL